MTLGEAQAGDEVIPARYCEERLAQLFTETHGADWKFVAEFNKWLFWAGGRWVIDITLRHFDLARAVARQASMDALADQTLPERSRERIATAIGSAKTVSAIIRLACADRRHAMSSKDWDSNPMLFNMQNGVLRLRTGEVIPARRDFYMTKISGALMGGACPTWLQFLDRVTGNDAELIAYLQRFAGYCLTGETTEHAFVFLWGLGGNGKTTFANALLWALGGYATTAPSETFVESHSERHPTDLAMLAGIRLVVVPEVADGQRWAASKIKQLTGGDRVRARFMRQDFFEFLPQFKLLFCGNHKPSFRNIDEAMRRRFHLVPFTQTIPAQERDTDLPKKLLGELGGILKWISDGAVAWQKMGLAPPAAVRDATERYLDDEDILRAWLNECCDRESAAFTPGAELHKSHHAWAEQTGEKFFGLKQLGQMLEDRGFQRARDNSLRGFRGLRLKKPQSRLEPLK
jgi:P4 family phage/plasmid primase-like protien